MEEKSFQYVLLFTGLFLCLLHTKVNGIRDGSQVGCIVPVVENAEISSTAIARQLVLSAGSTIRISCDLFYNLRDSDARHVDLHCLSNSSWDKSLPVCEQQTCRVSRLYHGFYPGNKLTYNHGENITFVCYNGFEKEYDWYRCDRTTAIPRSPRCIPASCSMQSLGDRMIPLEPHFSHGMLLSVSCERGFQLYSTNQTLPTCKYGDWDRPLTVTCQRVHCGEPMRASQSTIELLPGEVQDYVHGARVRYSCNDGWKIEGFAERECDNGQWTGSTPKCIVPATVRCMLPDRLRGERYYITGYYGNIFDDGLPIGEEVDITVRCNPGYLVQSQVHTSCLEGGVWSVPVPICVGMERLCSRPRYISRVRQYVNGEETNEITMYPHNELPEGTYIVSRCSQPGEYVLHGSANRTCYDGSWSGQEPRCVRAETSITFLNNQPLQIRRDGTIMIFPRSRLYIDCSVPSNKVARLVSDNGPSDGYFAQSRYNPFSRYRVALNPPRVSYSGRFTCQSRDNSVSHSVNIQFREIYCAPPRAPANGQIQDYDVGWQHGRYFMGKEVSFTCNNGYFLVGQRRITCVLGSWSHPTPACQRATCEELHAPAHGRIMGGNRVGDSVLVGCNMGYHLQGEIFLDCLETGQWSHTMPTCVEIPERPCDSVTCEVWQKCETDRNGVGVCRCISALDCPVSDEPAVVCGTDGRNYTNLCQLKALSCIRNSGVEEASNSTSCILGIPEREPTLPPIVYEEPSVSSSFDTYPISPVSETQEVPSANEGSVEPGRPHFCHANECPTRSGAELCQDATAIVIAYPDEFDAQLGIMRITIYDVMMGDVTSWTPESSQDVLLDISAASSRGCVCPSFEASDPVIIRFSQSLTAESMGQLLYSDIVLPYSQQLFTEITECL